MGRRQEHYIVVRCEKFAHHSERAESLYRPSLSEKYLGYGWMYLMSTLLLYRALLRLTGTSCIVIFTLDRLHSLTLISRYFRSRMRQLMKPVQDAASGGY